MKLLFVLILLQLSFLVNGQGTKSYLLAYTDSSSGQDLIGYKDPNGKIVISPKFSYVYTDTFYTMAIVLMDFKWVGIDKNEKVILIPFIFDNGPDNVEEGLFRIVENNKIGFADESGKKIISPKFDFATPFENGLSEYMFGGHKKYDKSGEHWSWVEAKERGYVNRKGQMFSKVKEIKNDKREAWTKEMKHVLLDKNGLIIKTFKR